MKHKNEMFKSIAICGYIFRRLRDLFKIQFHEEIKTGTKITLA